MKTISKIIYWTALASIFVFVVMPVVGNFFPLEFKDNRITDFFEQIRFFGLPATILLTLFGTLKKNDTKEKKIGKIGLTSLLALLSLLILFITVFSSMCSWSNYKILFENKKEPTTKIVLRQYGCGATDSGIPISKVCKIKEISPLLIWVTPIDTTKIDIFVWERAIDKSLAQ